jgi:hypothetical protein
MYTYTTYRHKKLDFYGGFEKKHAHKENLNNEKKNI